MHTPGSAAHHHAVQTHHAMHHRAVHTHHAAHHRAVGMHHAVHGAAHPRRFIDHGRAVYGGPIVSGLPAARSSPRAGRTRGRRTSGAVALLRFVFQLVVVAVVIGVVLLVVRPTHPEWLAHLVQELDGLIRTLRCVVP